MNPLRTGALAAILLAVSAGASASCGSAFCTLMTARYAQGAGAPPAGWSADVRVEWLTQDRLRSGTHDLDASQVSGEEAIERRTRNVNVVTTLEHGLGAAWSVLLRVPVVRRDHLHDLVDAATGLPSAPERWRFTKLGDVQLLARHQSLSEDLSHALAWYGGLKLPTGSIDIVNADGTRAERALQPGTGTTDLVLGAAMRIALGGSDALIGQAGVTTALNSREQYRPGARIDASAGWSHAFSPGWGGVLQVNLSHRGRDRGEQAEPENSGSTTLNVSPGLTWAVGKASTLYAYAQLPVYQNVNGIQLVPRQSFAVGLTTEF